MFKVRTFIDSDIDYIISRQINLYEVEYGFNTDAWKAYIADGVNQFIDQFDAEKDVVYIFEAADDAAGCIAITHIEDEVAQLRFFFIEPTYRGLGIGNKLMEMVMEFCKDKKYKRVILWTFSELFAARHLYGKHGFYLAKTVENTEWGDPILEERWDLDL